MASTVCLSYLHLLQTKLKETRRKKRPPHERNAKSSMLRYWCRRKQLLLIMLSIITLINPPRDRICWMRPNSDDWFILADSTFNREQWYENFRVTRDTFTIILNEIEPDIAKQDTPMRKAVPTRKKLAMTLVHSSLLCFFLLCTFDEVFEFYLGLPLTRIEHLLKSVKRL